MNTKERIKILATEHGISIPNLEKACGLGHGTISRWDVISPSCDKLCAVADYFGVSVDHLLGRDIPADEFTNRHLDPDMRMLVEQAKCLPKKDLSFLIDMARRMT